MTDIYRFNDEYKIKDYEYIIHRTVNYDENTLQDDEYTIVLLITDGGVTDFEETKEVLVNSCNKPLSVVLVSHASPASYSSRRYSTNQTTYSCPGPGSMY